MTEVSRSPLAHTDLIAVIERVLARYPAEHAIHAQWRYLLTLLEEKTITSHFVSDGDDYTGVAVIADGLVYDLEFPNAAGTTALSVIRPQTASSAMFHVGPMPGLPHGDSAVLSLVLAGAGDDVQAYWMARTENEVSPLQDFGRILLESSFV